MSIIFDLDGTLALIEHRRHYVEGETKDWDAFFAACVYDVPNNNIINVLHCMERHHSIEIWSGRSDAVREQTKRWLADNGIPGHLLTRMRPAGDHQPDDKLKRKWLHEERANGVHIAMAFDDRDRIVKMWRDEGVTCLQVAPGNF